MIGMCAVMLTDTDWAIYGPKRFHSLPSGWIEQAELCSFEKEAIGGKKKQAIDLSPSQIRIVLCVSEAVEKRHTVCFSGSREDPYTHWASVWEETTPKAAVFMRTSRGPERAVWAGCGSFFRSVSSLWYAEQSPIPEPHREMSASLNTPIYIHSA